MFPERPEPRSRPSPGLRPMESPPHFPPSSSFQRQQNPMIRNVMSMLQDADGNIDLEKIATTAQQINYIYSQVTPIISKFKRK